MEILFVSMWQSGTVLPTARFNKRKGEKHFVFSHYLNHKIARDISYTKFVITIAF